MHPASLSVQPIAKFQVIMKSILHNALFRFLASAIVAAVLVITVVGAGIRFYQPREEDPMLADLQQMKVVNLADNPRLAEAVRKEREKHATEEPRTPPPPPLVPERQITGFVHVEYIINPDGSVSDVRVIGAAPSGVYEQQAIARVSRSMHAPAYNDDGEAVPRRATEIVEFSVSASELRNPGLESR